MIPILRRVGGGRGLGSRRVLVTGGGGFLGAHLCARLLAEGATVASLSRTAGTRTHVPNLVRIGCDLTDAAGTVAAVGDFAPDVLVHLAAHPDASENLEQAHAVVSLNVGATVNALEAFRRVGGELFVFGDSTKVYGNCHVPYREDSPLRPASSYAIGKVSGWHFCEMYARVHRVNVCAVRPTMVYGPGQGHNLFTFVMGAIARGERVVRLDGGDQTRDPLYVGDAIEAYAATIAAGARVAGRCINIGGGREHTVADLARKVVALMGTGQTVVPVAARARPTEIWRSWCDNREAGELLGWRPRTDLDAGLRRTFAAHARTVATQSARP